ncbi:hypothetical protein [Ottowia massiliensis]|nr:hypothetical protein [Ottowia massiliensis]
MNTENTGANGAICGRIKKEVSEILCLAQSLNMTASDFRLLCAVAL